MACQHPCCRRWIKTQHTAAEHRGAHRKQGKRYRAASLQQGARHRPSGNPPNYRRQWRSQNDAEEDMSPLPKQTWSDFYCCFISIFNYQKINGRNSQTQHNGSDWQRQWLAPPEQNSWLRYCRTQGSGSQLLSSWVSPEQEARLCHVCSRAVCVRRHALSSVNLLHHALCLFVFITVPLWCPTVVLQHFSKSDKRGWLTRWPPWSFTNPILRSATLCLHQSHIMTLNFHFILTNAHWQVVSSLHGGSLYCFC